MRSKNGSLSRAAYRGEPPPADPLDRAQYFMMQRLYRLYERGALPKEDAAHLKGLVLGYEKLDSPIRLDLLDSFLESWGNEDLQGFRAEIKAISAIYLEELQ